MKTPPGELLSIDSNFTYESGLSGFIVQSNLYWIEASVFRKEHSPSITGSGSNMSTSSCMSCPEMLAKERSLYRK